MSWTREQSRVEMILLSQCGRECGNARQLAKANSCWFCCLSVARSAEAQGRNWPVGISGFERLRVDEKTGNENRLVALSNRSGQNFPRGQTAALARQVSRTKSPRCTADSCPPTSFALVSPEARCTLDVLRNLSSSSGPGSHVAQAIRPLLTT